MIAGSLFGLDIVMSNSNGSVVGIHQQDIYLWDRYLWILDIYWLCQSPSWHSIYSPTIGFTEFMEAVPNSRQSMKGRIIPNKKNRTDQTWSGTLMVASDAARISWWLPKTLKSNDWLKCILVQIFSNFHLHKIHRNSALHICFFHYTFFGNHLQNSETPETSPNLFLELSKNREYLPKPKKRHGENLKKNVGKSKVVESTHPQSAGKPKHKQQETMPPAPVPPAPGPQSWAASTSRHPSVPWPPQPRPCRAPLPEAKPAMEMGKSGKATKMLGWYLTYYDYTPKKYF